MTLLEGSWRPQRIVSMSAVAQLPRWIQATGASGDWRMRFQVSVALPFVGCATARIAMDGLCAPWLGMLRDQLTD
jgi:hypothetical protein